MATPIPNHATAEEKLIWFGLVLTYPCYMLGSLYIVGSVLGWMILAVLLLRRFVNGREDSCSVPVVVWVWVVAMVLMLVALIVAHVDRNLGTGQLIKSTIGWAKGWALLALFPLLGAILPFKQEDLVRGCCIVAVHSLIFSVVSLLVFALNIQGELYVSPLKVVGGPGEEFFTVRFFGMNPETGLPRWNYFGPWAPSAGLLSCIYLVICSQEKDKYWRNLALLGAALMCLLCQSRTGWVLFAALVPILLLMNRLANPILMVLAGVAITALVLLAQPLLDLVLDSYQQIKDSRPGSSRVRSALAQIALQRWQSEAPVWGHGIVERGPKIVEHMLIGSHHSWYGLLFVKGWVGAMSLAVPLGVTICYLAYESVRYIKARIALILMLVLVCYSFFENLEILVYLFWPALLWLGAALNPVKERGNLTC